MGKKLVDNSKSEEQLRFEAEIKEEIKEHKEEIKKLKEQIALEKTFLNPNKGYMKYCRDMQRYHKQKIYELNWVLS